VEHLSAHFENKLLGIVEKNSIRNKARRRLIEIKIQKGENNLATIKSKITPKNKKKKFFNSQHELKTSFGNEKMKFSQGYKQKEFGSGRNTQRISVISQSRLIRKY
jgi:hypothetical protein